MVAVRFEVAARDDPRLAADTSRSGGDTVKSGADEATSGEPMRSLIPGLLGDDSDKAWEWFGKHDPYYGVYTAPMYSKESLSEEGLRSFFASGALHVDRVLGIAAKHFGALGNERCLDFGCGVGRLVIPFAARFGSVVGVDVSPSMIEEAERNCRRFGAGNASFVRSLEESGDRFDLVHSYIVLQHIPTRKGLLLIRRLVDKTAPRGICFLHFTIIQTTSKWRKLASRCRRNIKPVHYALNLVKKRPMAEAYMQINEYNLNDIVALLFNRGIRDIWLEAENHDGPYSVCLAFRAP